jgi:hypothetical protein
MSISLREILDVNKDYGFNLKLGLGKHSEIVLIFKNLILEEYTTNTLDDVEVLIMRHKADLRDKKINDLLK